VVRRSSRRKRREGVHHLRGTETRWMEKGELGDDVSTDAERGGRAAQAHEGPPAASTANKAHSGMPHLQQDAEDACACYAHSG
jgi:hypothetical protein